jgi:hypothetical protein
VLGNQTDFYKPPPLTEADMKFLRDLAAPYPSLWPSIAYFIKRKEWLNGCPASFESR